MKNKIRSFKVLYSAAAILFGIAALFFIIINQFDNFRESEQKTKATIEISKKQRINDKVQTTLAKKATKGEKLQSAEKISDLDIMEKENPDQLLESEQYDKTESIVEGIGLTEKELRALHANQRQEIAQMHRNKDAIVIAPAEEGGKGITLGELLALHEQQKQAIASADDLDEIVIPALKEGDPGLTRSDLIELHKQQRLAIEIEQDWDQIVIPDSEDGYPSLSWDEVATLQELQSDEIWDMAADPYDFAAPFPEDGGPDMTVQELKNLHMKQSAN